MPSGSYVTVQTYTNRGYSRQGTYMNIHVYPLRADAYHTTGLCGNYNLNAADDGPYACTANCEAHRQELFTFVYCQHYQLNSSNNNLQLLLVYRVCVTVSFL